MSSISEVVHHVGLGHADARVADRERVVRLVRDELDLRGCSPCRSWSCRCPSRGS